MYWIKPGTHRRGEALAMGRAQSKAKSSPAVPSSSGRASSTSNGAAQPEGELALALMEVQSTASAPGSQCGGYTAQVVQLTDEYLTQMGLPSGYIPRTCSLCGNSSASESPFEGSWSKFM